MKKNVHLLAAFSLTVILMGSCGNAQKEHKDGNEQEPQAEKVCTWSYVHENSSVSWTAYKFTEMAGVGGKFDEFTVSGTEAASERQNVIAKAGFRIPVSSINTQNPDRDKKIRDFFFGSLDNSEVLSGQVTGIEGNEDMGTVSLSLKLNAVEKDVKLDYSFHGDTLLVSGMIDVSDWNAGAGIEKLNAECKQLHTGSDGKSVLHPNVRLDIRTVLKQVCE